MGIVSINYAMSASYGAYSQKITQATKSKLEELGYNVPKEMTESQGKKLLESHEAKKNESTNNQTLFQNNQGESDLLKRAKKLAEKLGISFNENISLTVLLGLIESTIQERLSVNKGNVEELIKLQALSQELAFIQAQSSGSSGYDNTNQALMQSLEMLSEYNKHFLK